MATLLRRLLPGLHESLHNRFIFLLLIGRILVHKLRTAHAQRWHCDGVEVSGLRKVAPVGGGVSARGFKQHARPRREEIPSFWIASSPEADGLRRELHPRQPLPRDKNLLSDRFGRFPVIFDETARD